MSVSSDKSFFWRIQQRIDNKLFNIGKGKYARLLKLARKPTREEYIKVVDITGLGIILVGLTGFGIYLLLSVVLNIP